MKIALVTGASSGLGREFVRQIAEQGKVEEIWAIARRRDRLEALQSISAVPIRVLALDLTRPGDMEYLRNTLQDELPDIRILVNAAGMGRMGPTVDIPAKDNDAMIDLNCRGLVDMTRATLPYMERGSRIIQVASAAAFTPLPHMNVYAATKSFVLHYTRALRWELHGTGITATALCPTWVKTGFEKVARTSGGGHDVGHLLGEQTPQEVVRRALCANKAHLAVACASPPSAALRLIGKVVPSCITMAGWDVLRRL